MFRGVCLFPVHRSTKILLQVGLSILAASMILCPYPVSAFSSWQRDTFTVSGWILPSSLGVADTSQYTKINNAGIDLLASPGPGYVATDSIIALTLDNLRLAYPNAFTLQTSLYYNTPYSDSVFTVNSDAPCNRDAINTTLCRIPFRRASVKGLFVWDEPCTTYCATGCGDNGSCFANVNATTGYIDSSSCQTGHMPYVNLLPIQGTTCFSAFCGGSDLDRYRCYLDAYLSSYNNRGHAPPVLSVDHYPYLVDGNASETYKTYFKTLRVMREKSRQYSIPGERVPMWMVVQLSPYSDTSVTFTQPTLAQVRAQVYISLAYGAKGIGYWTLAPVTYFPTAFGEGILKANGDTTSKYSAIRVLNQELHTLGPTLMKLDPIAAYHMDTLGVDGLHEDLMSFPDRVYNIVSGLTDGTGGSATEGMFGYFKHQVTGDDYLMVVNKSTTDTRTYRVALTTTPTAVYRISKATGQPVSVAQTGSSFDVTLAPGDGELFRVDDNVQEYIPNVNAITVNGNRTYFAHDKGTVMVNTATGYRNEIHDGTVFTPIVDFAVSSSGTDAYECRAAGVSGNVVKYGPDLTSGSLVWPQSPPFNGTRQVAVGLSTSRVIIGGKRAAGGVAVILTGTSVDSVGSGLKVNDLEYQPGSSNFVVAHDGGIKRFADTGGSALNTWTRQFPIVDVETLSDGVFAAKDDGTAGRVDRLTVDLKNHSDAVWTDLGANPRVVDIKLSVDGTQLVAASIKGATQKFTRLTAANLTPITSYAFTGPRTSYIYSDLSALLATDAAVYKVAPAGSGLKALPNTEEVATAATSLQGMTNPIQGKGTIAFALGREALVRLVVFDLQGREVQRLVDRKLSAGSHKIDWAPRRMMSGVYFIRFQSGEVEQSRKVLIIH